MLRDQRSRNLSSNLTNRKRKLSQHEDDKERRRLRRRTRIDYETRRTLELSFLTKSQPSGTEIADLADSTNLDRYFSRNGEFISQKMFCFPGTLCGSGLLTGDRNSGDWLHHHQPHWTILAATTKTFPPRTSPTSSPAPSPKRRRLSLHQCLLLFFVPNLMNHNQWHHPMSVLWYQVMIMTLRIY